MAKPKAPTRAPTRAAAPAAAPAPASAPTPVVAVVAETALDAAAGALPAGEVVQQPGGGQAGVGGEVAAAAPSAHAAAAVVGALPQGQAPAAASVSESLYTVISPLDHDGERYDVGREVRLSAKHAAPLLGNTVELAGASS